MKKGRVTATECCAFLDISATTFGQMAAEGIFERQAAGDGYDLKVVVRACCAHWRKVAAGRAAEPGAERVLSSARAAAALAQAEERRLRVAILRGEVIHRSAIRRAWGAIGAAFRETALSIPGKIASALSFHVEQDREAVEEIVRIEIYEMLDVMASGGEIEASEDEAVRHDRRGRNQPADYGEGFEDDVGMRAGRSADSVMLGRPGSGAGRATEPHRSREERSGGFLLSRTDGGTIWLR
jgi:phage terminase Nu1 subunit (DNA packaging protein)